MPQPSALPLGSTESLSSQLASDDYVRQRTDPRVGDPLYIHLADIKLFLDRVTSLQWARLLDYGCGGSPYRSLFRVEKYLRADYVPAPDLDCIIDENGAIPLADESCDAVLSTQVLEHVFDPEVYLREAFRVLKNGGQLILTTHGIWEDHPCPFDFWRWTADGLKKQIESAGFDVHEHFKLTTGPRALWFLSSREGRFTAVDKSTVRGFCATLFNKFLLRSTAAQHKWLDREFRNERCVPADTPSARLYLAIGVIAHKRA